MTKFKKDNLSKLSHLIKFILQTEKSANLFEKEKIYTFIVDKRLNKPEIKKTLEKCFFIKIKNIQSLNIKKNSFKKIYISLKKDSKPFNISLSNYY
jgi:ribosomal protein L23